jgi:hypothetical protein
MSKTTIIIESDTRERLKQVGFKGQTYDLIINSLLADATKEIQKGTLLTSPARSQHEVSS